MADAAALSSNRRDPILDSMRGLALVVMTVAHLPFPGAHVAYELVGFGGFAPAFLFVSGVCAALAIGRLPPETPFAETWRRGRRRAASLYLWHVALITFLVALAHFTRRSLDPASELVLEAPLLSWSLGILFLHFPPFADILPVYVLLALVTPLVARELRAGRAARVLTVSVALWTAAQFGLGDALLSPLAWRLPLRVGVTNPFAWQLPFVLGLYFGTRRAIGKSSGLRCSPAIAAALLVPTAWCFLVVRGLAPDGEAKRLTLLFADRSTFGPARLVDFLALAWLVAHVAAWRPKLLNWPAVAALGRHALPVFAFHIVVVGIVTAAAAEAKPYAAAVTAAAVLSLWIPAAVAERRRARGRLVAAPA